MTQWLVDVRLTSPSSPLSEESVSLIIDHKIDWMTFVITINRGNEIENWLAHLLNIFLIFRQDNRTSVLIQCFYSIYELKNRSRKYKKWMFALLLLFNDEEKLSTTEFVNIIFFGLRLQRLWIKIISNSSRFPSRRPIKTSPAKKHGFSTLSTICWPV